MLGLRIFVQVQTFQRRPFVPSHNFCRPDTVFLNFDLLAIWWICKVRIFPKTELSKIIEKYILLNWIVQSTYSRKDSIKEGNFYKAVTFSGTWVNLNAKICSEPTLWSPMELRVKLCPSLANHQLPEGDFASVTWLISHILSYFLSFPNQSTDHLEIYQQI